MTTIITGEETIHLKPRSVVIVGPKMTTKIFTDPDICRREVAWYLRVPWACPQLLDNTDRHLITETGQPVTDDPTPELRQLVTELEAAGYSHRDIHAGNLVMTPNGVRLVDWECAINQPGYDLHGPDSGIPIPAIHDQPMWWYADHPDAINHKWGHDHHRPLPPAPGPAAGRKPGRRTPYRPNPTG